MSLKNSDGKGEIFLLGCKAQTNEIQQYELAVNVQEEYTPRAPTQIVEKTVVEKERQADKKVLRETNQRGNIE